MTATIAEEIFKTPIEFPTSSGKDEFVATSELMGRSKTRNGDDRPSGHVSWRLERRVPKEPGSGDGKTVANSGQSGGCARPAATWR